ncbi:hypothetical protein KJ359_001727 [Pestalotiopsis sp. 9143b]|nr:hypothetical protein KJ359_001727 [Pestalotiopsis sp. 9143b]
MYMTLIGQEVVQKAINTLEDPNTKIQYDRERLDGDDGDPMDTDSADGRNPFVPEGHQKPGKELLSRLYNGATKTLETYLVNVQVPAQPTENLDTERYAPLEQYNKKIATEIGGKQGNDYIIRYTVLRAYLQNILDLETKIASANGPEKEARENEKTTMHRKIQKYLKENEYPIS